MIYIPWFCLHKQGWKMSPHHIKNVYSCFTLTLTDVEIPPQEVVSGWEWHETQHVNWMGNDTYHTRGFQWHNGYILAAGNCMWVWLKTPSVCLLMMKAHISQYNCVAHWSHFSRTMELRGTLKYSKMCQALTTQTLRNTRINSWLALVVSLLKSHK